jgi:uncharacterized protein
MPVTPTYPGVYIEEVPSGVRTIVGVATSITAFIGRALRGPINRPIRIQSFADFGRIFGGLWVHSTLSYAVQQYFLNGGADAIVVRVHNLAGADDTATLGLAAGGDTLTLEASSPGKWGNTLRAIVDHETKDKDEPTPDPHLFNLTIEEVSPATGGVQAAETFRNVSTEADAARFIAKVLEQESALVRTRGAVPSTRPDASPIDAGTNQPIPTDSNGDGDDGSAMDDAQIADPNLETAKEGLWALEHADLFNLLCIPPLTRETDVDRATLGQALAYCKKRRAMLLVDSPSSWTTKDDAVDNVAALGLTDENAAIFFPRPRMPDPLAENRLDSFAPCGAVAGIFARTDAQRGVWKAPAGLDATLVGVMDLSTKLTDGEQGQLNPIGVNCLRTFPVVGHVLWGARTLEGADRLASEWKYIPVRRVALYIEESLYRGTQWVVFEPNDEPLWAQIRLNVGAFMQDLFRRGAFQGSTPRDAYFVRCDKDTTTQIDIDRGIVNILVGFRPLKPAEFVIIKIQQLAGQAQA